MTLFLALLACHPKETDEDTGPLLDTGWFDTDAPPPECADQVVATIPAAGAIDVYYRDVLTVTTTSRNELGYTASIVDADGVTVASAIRWDGVASRFDVAPAAPLAPLATYSLVITDCERTHFIPFSTSALGLPIEGGAASLRGATYGIQLRDATFTRPEGLGGLIALYLDAPVLLGVQWADDEMLDLIGAQGYVAGSGTVRQLLTAPTWDYPLADFTDAPYVEAHAPHVSIAFGNVAIEIDDFVLSATFAADGQSLGGGTVAGLADTRNLGEALGLGEGPAAVCDVASGFGVSCQACADGEITCVDLAAVNVEGTRTPITVVRVAE